MITWINQTNCTVRNCIQSLPSIHLILPKRANKRSSPSSTAQLKAWKPNKTKKRCLLWISDNHTVREIKRKRIEGKEAKNEAESIRWPDVTAISCSYYLLQVILLIPWSSSFGFLFNFWDSSIIIYCNWDLGFCFSGVIRVNGIDFEEIRVDLSKRQQLSPEFKGTSLCVNWKLIS